MTILILAANPASAPGGVERFCRLLIDICHEKRWNVRMLTPQDLAGRTVSLNAIVEPLWAYRLGRTAARSVKGIDLVISNGIWGSWIGGYVPRVNVYHGTWAGNYHSMGRPLSPKKLIARWIRTRLERQSGRNAVNVAVSESVKREVERYYGLAVARVIENGVDLRRFSPPTEEEKKMNKACLGLEPDGIMALYAGRMEWGKGIDRVNQLAERLQDSKHDPAPSFCVLTPKIEERFFSRHVRYIMGDNTERVPQVFRAADVFVLPSRYEGCEFVTLEALSTGLPVIGASTGAMQMIRNRDPGLGRFINEDCSAEVLKMNLEYYLGLLKEERAELSLRARRYAEEWASLELFRRKWTALIEEMGDHGK